MNEASEKGNKQVLILFERAKRPNSPNYLGFLKKLKKYETDDVYLQYTGAALTQLTYAIVDGNVSITLDDGRDIRDFDVVFFRNWQKNSEAAHTCAEYLTFHNVPFIDRETGRHASHTKLTEMMQLSLAGIPVPDTLMSHDSDKILEFFATHDNKVVVKNAAAQKGTDNYLCDTIDHVLDIVNKSRKPFMIQQYIPSSCDYRVMVAGKSIPFIMKRESRGSGHIHNSSQGGRESKVERFEFTRQQLQDAAKAAQVLRRDLAGVDLIVDKTTRKHYILEVNYSPQVLKGEYEGDMVRPIPKILHRLAHEKRNTKGPESQ